MTRSLRAPSRRRESRRAHEAGVGGAVFTTTAPRHDLLHKNTTKEAIRMTTRFVLPAADEPMLEAVRNGVVNDAYLGSVEIFSGRSRISRDVYDNEPEYRRCFDPAVRAKEGDSARTLTRITLPTGEVIAGDEIPIELQRNQG